MAAAAKVTAVPIDPNSQPSPVPAEPQTIAGSRTQIDWDTVKTERTLANLAVRRERLMEKRDGVRTVRALSLSIIGGVGVIAGQAWFFAQHFTDVARLVANPALLPTAAIIAGAAGVTLVGGEVTGFVVRRRLKKVAAKRGLAEQLLDDLDTQRQQLDERDHSRAQEQTATVGIDGSEVKLDGGELYHNDHLAPPEPMLEGDGTLANPLEILRPARARTVEEGRGLELNGPGHFG